MLKQHPSVIEHAVRFTMEADSLNASILGADAEPGTDEFDLFVREVAREMTVKAGQKCTAIRRAFVPAHLLDAVGDALSARLSRVVVGNPDDATVTMGALASLDRWTDIAAERATLYARSVRAAQAACGGRLALQAAAADTVRSVCAYRFPTTESRDRAEASCKQRGIGTRRWYLPTIDRQPAFGHVAHLPTPVADRIGERLLGVPFYPGLAPAAIDEIADALGTAFAS